MWAEKGGRDPAQKRQSWSLLQRVAVAAEEEGQKEGEESEMTQGGRW